MAAPNPVAPPAVSPVVPPAGGTLTTTLPSNLITAEAYTRKFGSKGWEGLFKISTRLLVEKEIDIDDREAKILFTLEMMDDDKNPIDYILDNVEVILHVDDDPAKELQNIEIEGTTKGDVTLFAKAGNYKLFPGAALNKELLVKTGAFSNKNKTAQPALKGIKEYPVTIKYELRPFKSHKSKMITQAIFYVASD